MRRWHRRERAAGDVHTGCGVAFLVLPAAMAAAPAVVGILLRAHTESAAHRHSRACTRGAVTSVVLADIGGSLAAAGIATRYIAGRAAAREAAPAIYTVLDAGAGRAA